MKRVSLVVSCVSLSISSYSLWGQADAQRGSEVLKREHCVECHSLGDKPGFHTAPDLGKREARSYTPAALASVMWNHAPKMWLALESNKIAIPKLSEQDSEDVFAYLYSVLFFNQPADVARGAQVFDQKGCAGCHSTATVTGKSNGPGAPVSLWKSSMDPLMLVQEMWNHAAAMKGAQAAKHMTWVTLSGQDLIDVAAYIQGRKSLPVASSQFSLPEPGSGKALFGARCAICHQGTLALDQRLSNMTLADVAAEMWNHAPRMMNAPILSPVEMRKIVAYVWERQYMGPAGDVGRGRAAFVQKSCASCHEGPAAVAIARGDRVFTPIKMVGAVWIHAPSMLKKMSTAGADWPKLSPEEMADLVAYMNTRP